MANNSARISMDRMRSSEGRDTGSIPVVRTKFKPEPGPTAFALVIVMAGVMKMEVPIYFGVAGMMALAMWLAQLVDYLTQDIK